MAYFNQERKAQRSAKIKAILKKYGLKGSLSVRNHSTLVLTVKSGAIDFGGSYIQVNPYWYQDHYDGTAKEFLSEVIPAMYGDDYFDESDAHIDYFHCSHYIDVHIGRWNKPYELVG